jgi:hypothetical protein
MASQQHIQTLQKKGESFLQSRPTVWIRPRLKHKKRRTSPRYPYTTLQNRIRGHVAQTAKRATGHKLTEDEEDTLEEWALSMDNRGYPPRVAAVKDAATILLQERAGAFADSGVN